jgi:FAD/FMN-containing dehydrogenase
MDDALRDEALEAVEEIFGDRLKRRPTEGEAGSEGGGGALALVSPISAEEVERLARVAGRFSLPLIGLGAGTAREAASRRGAVLVRFDLMGGARFPGLKDELRVEAEPGTSWLELDDNLRTRGQGLAVYPTSAPRATVGGWLAMDGLGVGSYEYGWLSENVLSADVVLPGGGRRTLRGEELRAFLGKRGEEGLVVGAALRTRPAETDMPFGAVFDDPGSLTAATASLFEAGVPLWGLGGHYLLFGAYPNERAAYVEETLVKAFRARGGRALPTSDAYRAWGERFFPVAPSRPTPVAKRALVPLAELAQVLDGARHPPTDAVQGTVARSGQVLLLTLEE